MSKLTDPRFTTTEEQGLAVLHGGIEEHAKLLHILRSVDPDETDAEWSVHGSSTDDVQAFYTTLPSDQAALDDIFPNLSLVLRSDGKMSWLSFRTMGDTIATAAHDNEDSDISHWIAIFVARVQLSVMKRHLEQVDTKIVKRAE